MMNGTTHAEAPLPISAKDRIRFQPGVDEGTFDQDARTYFLAVPSIQAKLRLDREIKVECYDPSRDEFRDALIAYAGEKHGDTPERTEVANFLTEYYASPPPEAVDLETIADPDQKAHAEVANRENAARRAKFGDFVNEAYRRSRDYREIAEASTYHGRMTRLISIKLFVRDFANLSGPCRTRNGLLTDESLALIPNEDIGPLATRIEQLMAPSEGQKKS